LIDWWDNYTNITSWKNECHWHDVIDYGDKYHAKMMRTYRVNAKNVGLDGFLDLANLIKIHRSVWWMKSNMELIVHLVRLYIPEDGW